MSLFRKKSHHHLPPEVEEVKKIAEDLGEAAEVAVKKTDELMDEYREAERQVRQREIDKRGR